MTAIRIRIALICLVYGMVFKVSAGHIFHVALHYGNDYSTALLYPACIDAVILVSALTLTASRGVSKAAKVWARIGRWFGFAATIFCNLASSDFTSTVAALVALVPALALIIVTELAIHASKGTAANRPSRKS